MSTFVQRVRNSEIPHPTQRSFTLAIWHKAFADLANHSESDERLYKTGWWVFDKLEAIRRKLAPMQLDGFSRDELLRMYVGAANRNCLIIGSVQLPTEKQDFFIAEQSIQAKITEGDLHAPASHPDSLLLSSIDGLRFPIRQAFSHKDKISNSRLPDGQVLDRIKGITLLGQLYDAMESYWVHSLWNGWYIETQDDVDYLRPPEDIRPIISAVSLYRRQALSMELSLHVGTEWTHRAPASFKKQALSKLPRVIIKGSGKKRRYEVRSRNDEDDRSMTMIMERMKAVREYYGPLMGEPLPKVRSLTLERVFDAWEVLHALAESLIATLPSDTSVFAIDKLLRYAPTVHRGQIESLLITWCGVSADIARAIIEFFSYGPQSKIELWAKPLVRLDSERLAIVMTPLLYGNMERTIELWMKAGEMNLTEKGQLFEVHVRSQLREALSFSDMLKDAEIYPSNFVFSQEGHKEQIDLVIRIGNVVLIGEAKCILFPSEPIEYFHYFETLSDAAAQAERKVTFLSEHKDHLLQMLGLTGKMATKVLQLQAFVLVNQPYGAGFAVKETPVVDMLILELYFDGRWERMVSVDGAGEHKARSVVKLYSNEKEAAKNVVTYLKDPPQLRHYKDNIRPDFHWFPLLDDKDRKFVYVHPEVVLPLPNLDFKITAS